MNNDMEDTNGCSEEFAELCALSTSGELSAEEVAALDEHVTGCASCAALLREYTSLAHVAMAKLAAETADMVYTVQSDFEQGRAFYADLGFVEEEVRLTSPFPPRA